MSVLGPADFSERSGQSDPRCSVVGIEPHGFGKLCNGPLGVVQLDKDRTQGVPGLGVLRVFRDGLLELGCRGFVVALLAQHNPELPMRTRVSRVDFQNRLEFGLRRVEITPQPEGLGQIIAILGAVRSERDRLSQGLD